MRSSKEEAGVASARDRVAEESPAWEPVVPQDRTAGAGEARWPGPLRVLQEEPCRELPPRPPAGLGTPVWR